MQTDVNVFDQPRSYSPRRRNAQAPLQGGRRSTTCARCPQENPNTSMPGQAYCKPCHAAYNRDWNAGRRQREAAILAELAQLRAMVGQSA